ncbi:MAG TPA: phospholipase D-like domain-containing protein [Herpetosiphonaceae bacterium]
MPRRRTHQQNSRRTRQGGSRRIGRNDLPLNKLIPLLLILAALWLYQNGYFDRWLEQIRDLAPSAQRAPELDDGSQPEAPSADEPVVPQPSVAPRTAPPPQDQVETETMRGYSGSWYQVYFTKPQYPERAENRVGGLDETIAADIDAAQRRVELASFDFDLPKIAEALIRAQQRGVQVRVSIDGENLETPEVSKLTGDLQAAGIPVFFDEREAFMHNKFIVIDETIVWTGSMNLTVNDAFRNNNNMLRIADPRLAANYTAKAEDIFQGAGGTSGSSVLVNPQLTIDSATVVNAFSPDDPITEQIVERLQAAQQSIDVMAFAFTSDPIADTLIEAKQRGLAVRTVMESRNTRGTGSELGKLKDAGVDIHSDGNCYIMHSKTMIIDDHLVITGSFNFTRAAQTQNDENVLIVDDAGLAARYKEEFERVYQQALEPTRCG